MAGRLEPTSSSAMARSLDLISAPLTRATTGSVFCAHAAPATATDASVVTRRSTLGDAGNPETERRGDGELITTVLIRVVPSARVPDICAIGPGWQWKI